MRSTGAWRRIVLLGGMLALVSITPCLAKSVSGRRNTGPDSFLTRKVYTTKEFLAEYQQDPVLRQRLAKHFHMPEAQLTQYFREELREVTFQRSGWLGTYGVNQNGRIYPVRTYVRKGTKALGLADGTPLFKLPCGNPFRPVLPRIQPPMGPRPGLAPVEPLPAIPPVGPVSIEPGALQSPEEYVLGQEIPLAPVFEVPVTTEGSHFFIPPLWFPHGGGGEGPPPPPVPEPASLLLLGIGTALLGSGLARRHCEH